MWTSYRVAGLSTGRGHTCHILPPSEIDLGLCLAVLAGSGGKYLFHRIGWKGRIWQLWRGTPRKTPHRGTSQRGGSRQGDKPKRQEGIRNRSESAEPKRTEANRFISEPAGTERGTEPNQTEPRRVLKMQADPRRTGKYNFPNRTADFSKSPEPNRTESNGFPPEEGGAAGPAGLRYMFPVGESCYNISYDVLWL